MEVLGIIVDYITYIDETAFVKAVISVDVPQELREEQYVADVKAPNFPDLQSPTAFIRSFPRFKNGKLF